MIEFNCYLDIQNPKDMFAEKVKLYENLIRICKAFDKKGKTMPYTSVNGHMFSLLNKDGQLGIRFPEDLQQKYLKKLRTTNFKSHGAIMQGYLLMPEKMWGDLDELSKYMIESYHYVKSLKPKK